MAKVYEALRRAEEERKRKLAGDDATVTADNHRPAYLATVPPLTSTSQHPGMGQRPQRLPPTTESSFLFLSLLPRHQLHGKGVHAMTTVGCGKAFSKEYVGQMAAAVGALDLRSLTIGIG